MPVFKSRFIRAFEHANIKFKYRIEGANAKTKDVDRRDGYQLLACTLYPFDVVKGYFVQK